MAKKKYKKRKMKAIEKVAIILLLVGGLNWGLVGAFNFNLVEFLLGMGLIAKIIYGAVGISALIGLFSLPKILKS